ncbi:MAG: ATP-binding protein, partial [Planctomycetota bacterium]
MAARKPAASVKLRPQDPFDLIRLLARSQSDPRKAVAELVQNSLDAGAQHIELTWLNEKAKRVLRLRDDGRGIFPEMEREDALRRIATTIGHSHKRQLSPSQRRELMILGKYGIGLIGFWSVSAVMEIESRVGGGQALLLRLFEDQEKAELVKVRASVLAEDPTYTEITLRDVHEGAARVIRPPRLQAYLAGELRGQLLERAAELTIKDRIARGTAQKLFLVKPQPYLGAPLAEFATLVVEGHEEARVELYFVPGDEERTGRVTLACGGATVLDDIALIDGHELPRPVWASGRLEGVVDYPELEVAPGSRRGFSPDAAAEAFLRALDGLERALEQRLAEESERAEAQRTQSMAKDIRRAFRSVAARLPEYELFDVKSGARPGERGVGGAAARGEGAALEASEESAAVGASASAAALEPLPESAHDDDSDSDSDGHLFPPGPLARVQLVPASLRLAPEVTRALRA